MEQENSAAPVVLITGAAKRLGANTARYLHERGMNIVLHYRGSSAAAHALQRQLQKERADSVLLIQAELDHIDKLASLVKTAVSHWGRLDALVNNASRFYPTPIGNATDGDWQALFNSNLKAPFFLAQAAAPHLAKQQGCIINMVDIHAQRPLKQHSLYCMAKAGLAMMTQSLANELGPEVRVNGVAPGAILWPEGLDELSKQRIISKTALKRPGMPDDIAKTIAFLIEDAPYVTGQILAVDGGRSSSPY